MAIVTDSIVDVGNYITFNIGLSKAISNYTADEIWNFPYCSSSWDAFRHVCDESYQGVAPGSIEASEFQMPFHFTGFNQMYVPATYNFEEGQIEYNQGDQGIYGKIIWLCETGDTSITHIFGTQRCITNTDGVKIITQMDMTQVYLFLDTFQNPANNDPMYTNYDNFKIKEDHDGITTYEHARNASIFPAVMFQYNGKLYIHRIFQDSYTNLDWSWWLSYYGDSGHGGHTELQGHTFNAQPVAFTNDANAYLPINIMRQFSGLRPTSTERFYTASDIEDVGVRYQWMYGYDGGRICPATETKYLQMASWYGMMFHHGGKYYKPIIENGYVSGYTDDMTVPSDIDNWIGSTNHDVPPAPPSPTPSTDDDYADMGLGVGTNVGGLTNYAIMSTTDLATLLADFNEHLETGMSIQNNFVCLYKLGPLSSFLCNISTRAIVMSANGENNFVSVDDYAVVSGQKSEHYFGKYDVPRFTNTFYDFSPYSTYELFIPCCGWVPLPDTVAGRRIHVYLIFDLASCTCKGVVRIDGTTVAEISGVLGSSVPFYMIEHGMERLAQVTAITQTLSSLAVGGVGAASGNAGVAAFGLSQLTQSLNDLNVSGNTNFTAIKGSNGDMTAVGNGEYCTIKVTHPVIDGVVNNSMFGHSVGYLCNTIGKLSGFSGFTVCGNPHVTFSASAEEREEIERLLSMGVIL